MCVFKIEEGRSGEMEREIPSSIHLYCNRDQTSLEEIVGICQNKDDLNMNFLIIIPLIIELVFVILISYCVNILYVKILPVIDSLIEHLFG